jgi:hypothetical protein
VEGYVFTYKSAVQVNAVKAKKTLSMSSTTTEGSTLYHHGKVEKSVAYWPNFVPHNTHASIIPLNAQSIQPQIPRGLRVYFMRVEPRALLWHYSEPSRMHPGYGKSACKSRSRQWRTSVMRSTRQCAELEGTRLVTRVFESDDDRMRKDLEKRCAGAASVYEHSLYKADILLNILQNGNPKAHGRERGLKR